MLRKFVYLLGAPPEQSYPNHLQNLFGNTIQVINEGRPNLNTTFQLDKLEEQLLTYHPDLIVLQTGEPNS